jgi:hypothetical protein
MRAHLLATLLSGSQSDRGSPLEGVKHILRKVGARTKETLIEAMGLALAAVSDQDVRGFFVHCGYRTPAQQL